MKVCAVIIWYNPNGKMWENISKYLSFIDKCIIVDNSDKDNKSLIKSKSKKIIYVPNKDNLGIAKALNQGCEKAKELGFEWVLTMDQDSSFDEKNIKKYFHEAEKIYNKDKKAVSFTVNYNKPVENKIELVKTCITSGNLLNIDAWEKLGGFDEKLFIYEVDTIFAFLLRKKGYKIFEFYNVKMNHNIFDKYFKLTIFGKKYNFRQDDSPLAKYYITRNSFEKRRFFPKYDDNPLFLIKLLVKVIFFEHQKIKKLKMIYLGWRDFKKRKFGRYE